LYNDNYNFKNITVSIFFSLNQWKSTFAIKMLLTIFLGAIILTFWHHELWPWTVALVIASRLTLTVAGLLPRTSLLGPNITRLPHDAALRGEIAITIDDGPDPYVTPRVLEILDQHQAKATFFCIGKNAANQPELCREIIRRGHAIENHSLSHQWYFSLLWANKIHVEVEQAQLLLGEITGQTPRFFRPTAGLRNLELEPVLDHLGLRLCAWSKRGFDTKNNNPDAVLKSLMHDLKGGDILLLHDGSAARGADGTPVILSVLPTLLKNIQQANLHPVTLRAAIA
jgi:peptidoglycan-N-acetylglucosamine deacetylase